MAPSGLLSFLLKDDVWARERRIIANGRRKRLKISAVFKNIDKILRKNYSPHM